MSPGALDPGNGEDPVARFIERFAAVLTDSGMPRMPSRVFVALIASDSGRRTAGELAEVLRVSPAAVSGAVRYLTHVGLVSREREPGSRRDVFRVGQNVLYTVMATRDNLMARWESSVRDGVQALGEDTPAGMRAAEMVEFVEFLREEMAAMLDRWRARQATAATAAGQTRVADRAARGRAGGVRPGAV